MKKISIIIFLILASFLIGNYTVMAADCDIFDPTIIKYLNKILSIIKYSVPIIILVFSAYDFIIAITGDEAEKGKKAAIKFVKRTIIGVVIFFVPTLINLLLKLINDNANGTCGIGNIIILNKIIKYIVY